MAQIPQEMPLIELCKLLNITPSWVSKSIKELNLPRSGRGKLRAFTRDEYYTFRNIRIMLMCNFSWSHIKELYTKEQSLRKDFESFIGKLEKEQSEGKIKLNGGKFIVFLVLQPNIEYSLNKYEQDGVSYGICDVFFNGGDYDHYHISSQLEKIYEEVDGVIKILGDFKDGHFYEECQVE